MRIAVLLLVVLLPAAAAAQTPQTGYVYTDQIGVLPDVGGAPTIFYINKNGGQFRASNTNDARTNNSTIVSSGISTIPPWNVSAAGWTHVKNCMIDMFSRFNVTITDVDPGNVPHFEIVIAGEPGDVGMGGNVGGVSPFTYDCSVIPNSIVYTFAEVYGTNYQSVCHTSAQEVAHSFGLDHEHLCQDPMTYLSGCGNKTFQDVDANCGEGSPRECACGGYTQNSVEMLYDRLGPAATEPPNQPPTVEITAPDNGATVGPGFSVGASASDDAGVTRVEFRVDGTLVNTDTSAPYGFTTSGSLSEGQHTVSATAFDADDASASDTVTVTVEDGAPTPTPDAGPGPGDPDAGPGGGGAGGDDDDDGFVTGGCSAGGGAGGLVGLALLGLLAVRRRRSN